METTRNMQPIIITREDFNLLKPYVAGASGTLDIGSLAHELNRATVVDQAECPRNVVRLNSKVSVLDLATNRVLELVIVLPESADISRNRISVLTPMGTALLGFKVADEVHWRLPAGLKRLRVLNVSNSEKLK